MGEYPGDEVPVRGGFVVTLPQLEVVFADGVCDLELQYQSYDITETDGYSTLRIIQSDKYYPLQVISSYRLLPEYDLIEKQMEVINTGKKESVKIETAHSGSVFLPEDAYLLTHFSGVWGHEMTPQHTQLTQGTKTVQSRDFKPHGSSSFIIRPVDEKEKHCGKAWFGTLKYTGNWRMDFEKFFFGHVQILGGINFWDQEVMLKPGQSFITPALILGYTEEGEAGVTRRMTSFVREKIVPQKHRDDVRPVLYNSWYATLFDVNEPHQLALAEEARKLGVETFVIDDGWFKNRVGEHAGLGDWTVDTNKFPNGLSNMIGRINAMGLDFGIWIEPEMVNPDSDLFRKHPEWVFRFNNRKIQEGRGQYTLNLAREDVYRYLYTSISGLLRENNIKYVKWDMNKPLTNPGFPTAAKEDQRAVRIKYIENLYRLVDALRSEFPEVWFENCSSGGGRIDLGMMSRYDFNWVSDNTDPVERIFLQDSYLTLFPANTMISWVTEEDWHKQEPTLGFKFDVSMAGVLGVGYDITKWSDEEKKIATEKIALFKEIREVIHRGDSYRIISPFDENRSILQYVSKNQKESVLFVYNLAEYPKGSLTVNQKSKLVKLEGLLPEATY